MSSWEKRLAFEPGVSSAQICERIQSLALPLDDGALNLARYALTELVINAARASAERGATAPVTAWARCEAKKVHLCVEDSGGGFDVGALPYDFSENPNLVDPESDAMCNYREANRFLRFGLGLLMIRRAVDDFHLAFLDREGREVPWTCDGSIRGTRVAFSVRRT